MPDLRERLHDAADAGPPLPLDFATLRRQAHQRRSSRRISAAVIALVVCAGLTGWYIALPDVRLVGVADQPLTGTDLTGWRSIPAHLGSLVSYVDLVPLDEDRVAVIAGADSNATNLNLVIVNVDTGEKDPAPGHLDWRAGYASVWTGTELIIAGGGNASADPLKGAAYNPQTHTWRDIAAPPHPSVGDESVWTGDELLSWNAGLAYDPSQDTWREIAHAPLKERGRPALASSDRWVFVWGGCDPGGPASAPCDDDHSLRDGLSDGAVYDTATGRWEELPQSPLAARDRPEAVWTGEEFVVWGGHPEPGSDGGYAAAWNPATGTWRGLPRGPLAERSNVAIAAIDGRVFVWGGVPRDELPEGTLPEESPKFSDGAVLDPSSGKWTQVGGPEGVVLRNPVAAWTGQHLALTGDELTSIWKASQSE